MTIAKKIFKSIGIGLSATFYYLVTIILGICLSITAIIYGGLKIYSNVINDYSKTQVAWNEVTNDIYNDLSACKNQIEWLNYIILQNPDTETVDTQKYQLLKVSRAIEEIDNAMTYPEQYELYKAVPSVLESTKSITANIDTNNQTNFDYSTIISNNKELLSNYNDTVPTINNNLSSPFGKLMSKIFNLHTWPEINIEY